MAELPKCPQCQYPLRSNSQSTTGVLCQRCNTWVESNAEGNCQSSCTSCLNNNLNKSNDNWVPLSLSGSNREQTLMKSCLEESKKTTQGKEKNASIWKSFLSLLQKP